ncbi:hypothetical protein JCM11641_004206 [Rhodosporidiobolus odoratus]
MRSSISRRALAHLPATRSSSSTAARPPAPPQNVPKPSTTVVSDKLARVTRANADLTGKGLNGSEEGVLSSRPQPEELLTALEETIKTHGPLPISRYMTLCLSHPTLGYYTTRKVFGKEGDFVTSPEISQVFGELLAVWFVTQWLAQGAPKKVRVVELGPGKGTLLADILRTFRSLPAHSSPPISSIHLVESSSRLRTIQKSALEAVGCGSIRTEWYGDIKEVQETEEEWTVLIAHEFFDALPIHVFEHTQKGWREVLVDVSDPKAITTTSKSTEPLRLVLSPTPTPASTLYSTLAQLAFPSVGHQQIPDLLHSAPAARKPGQVGAGFLNVDTTLGVQPPSTPSTPSPLADSDSGETGATPAAAAGSLIAKRFARLPLGSRLEVSPASWEIARDLAKLAAGKRGGAGLVVDYGDSKGFGRSWRGFRKHQVVDPLTEPGHTDLTANVDFEYLAEAMGEFARTHGPIPQSRFLTSLGLQPRLASLLRNAQTPERRSEIESAAKRLVDKGGMGEQYRVMALLPRGEGQKQNAEGVFPFDLK